MAISSPEMMLVPAVLLEVICEDHRLLYTEVDITEASATDLAANTIFVSYTEVLHQGTGQ